MIYLDDYGRLFGDTLEELHEFAKEHGIQVFQDGKTFKFYNLPKHLHEEFAELIDGKTITHLPMIRDGAMNPEWHAIAAKFRKMPQPPKGSPLLPPGKQIPKP
ncbi:MAG: hypothetical protein ACWGQW_15225 [bacterium]